MKKLGKVMLIDDDDVTNFYNKTILEQMNCCDEIIVFEEAVRALEFLKNEHDSINLILLDVNMPIMNGWDFIEAYRLIPSDKKAKIVMMLSSSANSEDRERAERIELIKKFINKPLTEEAIQEVMDL